MKKILIIIMLFFIPVQGFAVTAEEKGLEIAVEANKRDDGFNNSTANMTMVLRNRHGEESIRSMKIKSLEVADDGDKSMSIFDNPKDVKGTAFLSFTHKTGPDDQWLYLPALKRVKRISSNNKSGSFMGSEFAYEDIASQEVEKYTYKYLKDEPCGHPQMKECFVVESYPVDRKSGYTRLITWIDKEEYRSARVDYYDRKNSMLKTLTFGPYKKYLDKHWRPDNMKMVNHQTGKSTELSWTDYSFKTGLTDNDFTKNSLKRAK